MVRREAFAAKGCAPGDQFFLDPHSCQERANLVSKGTVPVLYGLSSDEDLTTLHYVACTLVRLGMEEQCHARMIQEGAAR